MSVRSAARKSKPGLEDARSISLPVHDHDGKSWLAVIEGAEVPMRIRRVFTVFARRATVRGRHAHRRCNQFLVCLAGRIAVGLDDGRRKKRFVLASPGRGLFVPAGIWATQTYHPRSSLLVLCDRAYEAGDYIRDYRAFRRFRGFAARREKTKSAP